MDIFIISLFFVGAVVCAFGVVSALSEDNTDDGITKDPDIRCLPIPYSSLPLDSLLACPIRTKKNKKVLKNKTRQSRPKAQTRKKKSVKKPAKKSSKTRSKPTKSN